MSNLTKKEKEFKLKPDINLLKIHDKVIEVINGTGCGEVKIKIQDCEVVYIYKTEGEKL